MTTSKHLKTALLHYLRFKRQAYVATEVSYHLGIADILFSPKKEKCIYEVECKISKSDFLNEWKHKDNKHKLLEKGNVQIDYFYFCVPKDLEEFALEQIKDTKYGLMTFEEKWVKYKRGLQEKLDLCDCISVTKIAKKLKEDTVYYEHMKSLISLRAMSELATLYKEINYNGSKSSRQLIREKVKEEKQ